MSPSAAKSPKPPAEKGFNAAQKSELADMIRGALVEVVPEIVKATVAQSIADLDAAREQDEMRLNQQIDASPNETLGQRHEREGVDADEERRTLEAAGWQWTGNMKFEEVNAIATEDSEWVRHRKISMPEATDDETVKELRDRNVVGVWFRQEKEADQEL